MSEAAKKSYDWSKFTDKIAVKAPIDKLYNMWTSAQELEKWFLRNAQYFTPDGDQRAKDELCKPGDRYQWEWYGYDVMEEGKVIEVNGNDLFKFSFAGECTVTVKFTTFDEYTIIELTQENIPVDEEHKVTTHLGCNLGWSFYLANIKSLTEGGIDLRNKDPKIKPMLNN